MTKDLEHIADEKINEMFTRWVCDECERICEHVCKGSDKPLLCLYGRANCEWNELSSPIYITIEEDIVYGSMDGSKSNFKFKRNKVRVKDRKDKNGRPFYDLYYSSRYVDSYATMGEVEEKIKKLCGE